MLLRLDGLRLPFVPCLAMWLLITVAALLPVLNEPERLLLLLRLRRRAISVHPFFCLERIFGLEGGALAALDAAFFLPS